MRIIALLLVAIVALSHVGFLVLEMFYWDRPLGLQVFETTPEFADHFLPRQRGGRVRLFLLATRTP